MNLIELLFLVAALVLAAAGASFGSQWGFFGGAGFAIIGFLLPFSVSQLWIWFDEDRFSRTRPGILRDKAESILCTAEGLKLRKSWRGRPQKAKDGSLIFTIFYGDTRPPLRAFFRVKKDSDIPKRISDMEASSFIKIHPMK